MNYSGAPLETQKGMDNKPYKPERIWWFERPDGTVFQVDEKAAWGLYSGKVQVVGIRHDRPKIVGVSDGTAYAQGLQEARELFKDPMDMPLVQERLKKAIDEEYEKGKGTIIIPRNFDIVDERGNPTTLNGR